MPAQWRSNNSDPTLRTAVAPPVCPDAVSFARDRLHFFPDPIQEQLLLCNSHQVILNCSRQWGKSTLTAVRAVWEAVSQPASFVLVASPSERQSGEFVRKTSTFAARLGLKTRGDGLNRHSLVLPNGSRIVAIPASEETIRGFSAVSLLIIDEAARVSDELYDALLPMLATSNGRLWLLSTPWGKEGFFYDEWTAGGPEWHRVIAKAPDCPRISPEFIERMRRTRPDNKFRREYLCEFMTAENRLFDRDIVEAMFVDDEEAWTL